MRNLSLLGSLVAVLGIAASSLALAPGRVGSDAERIEMLIQQLGATRFADRDKAQRALETIGAPALEALQKAAKSQDQELSRRAGELAKKIGAKVAAANLLAPKRVNLTLKDTPVPEAVAELQRQSGYTIVLNGNRAALAARKVTLDTGDTTFWEAFDQLCQKAGLVETGQVSIPQPTQRLRAIQTLPAQPAAPVLPVVPPANPPKAPVLQAQVVPGQAVPQAKQIQPAPVPLPAVPVAPPAQIRPGVIIQGGVLQGNAVGGRRPTGGQAVGGGPIVVKDGKPQTVPTAYAGAVRVRALPTSATPGQPGNAGEAVLHLEVSAEPRLQGFTLEGSPMIRKAIDDQGQTLSLVPNPVGPAGANATAVWHTTAASYAGSVRQVATVRLRLGEKRAGTLQELQGSLTAQVLAPTEPLVVLDNVLKAAGQTAKGKDGGSLQLLAVNQGPNGDVQLRIRMENLPGRNPFAGRVLNGAVQVQRIQVQVGGVGRVQRIDSFGGNHANQPSLLDAQGRSFRLVQGPATSVQINNGQVTEEMTLVYRPNPGQGEPARLVVSGQRTVTVEVPFTLRNVPLP